MFRIPSSSPPIPVVPANPNFQAAPGATASNPVKTKMNPIAVVESRKTPVDGFENDRFVVSD